MASRQGAWRRGLLGYGWLGVGTVNAAVATKLFSCNLRAPYFLRILDLFLSKRCKGICPSWCSESSGKEWLGVNTLTYWCFLSHIFNTLQIARRTWGVCHGSATHVLGVWYLPKFSSYKSTLGNLRSQNSNCERRDEIHYLTFETIVCNVDNVIKFVCALKRSQVFTRQSKLVQTSPCWTVKIGENINQCITYSSEHH